MKIRAKFDSKSGCKTISCWDAFQVLEYASQLNATWIKINHKFRLNTRDDAKSFSGTPDDLKKLILPLGGAGA